MAFDGVTIDPGSGGAVLMVNSFTDTDSAVRVLPYSGLAYGAFDAIPTPVSTSAGLPVAQQGTWTIQPGNTANTTAWLVTGTGGTFPVTDSGGSLTVDAPVGTPLFVRLSDGSSAITTLPVSLASVPSHAVTNAGTFVIQVDGAALTALQLIDDMVYADNAAFTDDVSKFGLVGGVYQSAPQTITDGRVAPILLDANGKVQVATHAVTQSGTWTVTGAGGTFPVTGTFWQATQPVSLASVPSHAVTNAGTFVVQVDGTALTRLTDIETNTDSLAVVGNGAAATAVRVTMANDSTGIMSLTTSTASIGKLASNTGVTIGAVEIAAAQTLAVTNAGTFATQATLQAGTALIGKVSASPETSTIYDGSTALTPKFAVISASTSGNNTIVAAVASKKIRVLAYNFIGAGAVNGKFQSGASGTDLTGLKYIAAAGGGICAPFNPAGWFETGSNTLLNLNLSGAVAVGGELVYVEV
jgi:hypothetical protein